MDPNRLEVSFAKTGSDRGATIVARFSPLYCKQTTRVDYPAPLRRISPYRHNPSPTTARVHAHRNQLRPNIATPQRCAIVDMMADPIQKSEPIPKELLALVDPWETSLLECLKEKFSRLMLEEISENDCGEEGLDHLSGIEQQMYDNVKPQPLHWCPREVLELERWVEPATSDNGSDESFERGHLKRLLACTILLRSAGYKALPSRLSVEDFFLETSAASLVQLTRSSIHL